MNDDATTSTRDGDHRIEEGAWEKPVSPPKAEARPAGLPPKRPEAPKPPESPAPTAGKEG